jgi:lipopolysaccharide biosynthesis glycosyltransferase
VEFLPDSVSEARASSGRHLDFHIGHRPHSSLGGSTPDQAYFTSLCPMSIDEEVILVTASDSHFLSGVAVLFASALTHLASGYRLRAVLLACDIDPRRVEDFKKGLASLAGPHFRLQIIPLSRERFAGIKPPRSQLTVAAYGRLYIPEVLEGVSKALYLDCDIIVTRDLGELWEIPFEGHALMAVAEPGHTLDDNLREPFGLMDHDIYFVSATLAMDLDQIRTSGADRTCLDLALKSNHHFPQEDQSILNVVFARSTKYLDSCWGQQVCLEPDKPNVVPNEPVLIHTIFIGKPWYYSRVNARGIIKLFYHYLDKTEWEQYRDDEARFHHSCSNLRYAYTLFRMRLRYYLRLLMTRAA